MQYSCCQELTAIQLVGLSPIQNNNRTCFFVACIYPRFMDSMSEHFKESWRCEKCVALQCQMTCWPGFGHDVQPRYGFSRQTTRFAGTGHSGALGRSNHYEKSSILTSLCAEFLTWREISRQNLRFGCLPLATQVQTCGRSCRPEIHNRLRT